MIDVQDIEEIIEEDVDSPIYAKFLEMEYNETVDDLIKYRKINDPGQLFQLFLTTGLNSKGQKRVQRKLQDDDFYEDYVYDNFEKILQDDRYWKNTPRRPHTRTEKGVEKIFKYREKRIRRYRKNHLENLDFKYRKKNLFKKRSFFDLNKKKKMSNLVQLDGHIMILFDLQNDSDLVEYVGNHPSFDTTMFDIYEPSYISQKPFDKSYNSDHNLLKDLDLEQPAGRVETFKFNDAGMQKSINQSFCNMNTSDLEIFSELNLEISKAKVSKRPYIESLKMPELKFLNNNYFRRIDSKKQKDHSRIKSLTKMKLRDHDPGKIKNIIQKLKGKNEKNFLNNGDFQMNSKEYSSNSITESTTQRTKSSLKFQLSQPQHNRARIRSNITHIGKEQNLNSHHPNNPKNPKNTGGAVRVSSKKNTSFGSNRFRKASLTGEHSNYNANSKQVQSHRNLERVKFRSSNHPQGNKKLRKKSNPVSYREISNKLKHDKKRSLAIIKTDHGSQSSRLFTNSRISKNSKYSKKQFREENISEKILVEDGLYSNLFKDGYDTKETYLFDNQEGSVKSQRTQDKFKLSYVDQFGEKIENYPNFENSSNQSTARKFKPQGYDLFLNKPSNYHVKRYKKKSYKTEVLPKKKSKKTMKLKLDLNAIKIQNNANFDMNFDTIEPYEPSREQYQIQTDRVNTQHEGSKRGRKEIRRKSSFNIQRKNSSKRVIGAKKEPKMYSITSRNHPTQNKKFQIVDTKNATYNRFDMSSNSKLRLAQTHRGQKSSPNLQILSKKEAKNPHKSKGLLKKGNRFGSFATLKSPNLNTDRQLSSPKIDSLSGWRTDRPIENTTKNRNFQKFFNEEGGSIAHKKGKPYLMARQQGKVQHYPGGGKQKVPKEIYSNMKSIYNSKQVKKFKKNTKSSLANLSSKAKFKKSGDARGQTFMYRNKYEEDQKANKVFRAENKQVKGGYSVLRMEFGHDLGLKKSKSRGRFLKKSTSNLQKKGSLKTFGSPSGQLGMVDARFKAQKRVQKKKQNIGFG